MGTAFWIRRYLTVTGAAFLIIFFAQLIRGRSGLYAAEQAAIWSLVSATIFTVSRYYQARRGRHCSLCRDTPELADTQRKS